VTKRERLDVLLVERGLAESRSLAHRLVMAGRVRVTGEVALRPAQRVPRDAAIAVDQPPRFVSRGGEKLEAALAAFEIPVQGKVCADVGASTGGFTDCLLQRGAARVYAIDVGHGVLHWRLRGDPRVVVMEKTNARHLTSLPEPVGLVSVDVSFISLKLLLPSIRGWLAPGADLLLLVKPQFEAGRQEIGRGGVVRREEVRRSVLRGLLPAAEGLGLGPQGIIRSPLIGPKGNVEFLLWCRQGVPAADLAASILAATVAAER
jgi:23S rRNA (cytidine1920-2'-O)/16S rRNA (cytidine1409-2'-O)-methyltransferase